MRLWCLILGFFWFNAPSILAQSQPTNPYRFEVELGAFGATTDQIPFWLRTNQYGTVPLEGPAGTARIGIAREYRADSTSPSRRGFDWGASVYGVANTIIDGETKGLLPEAYVKARFRWLELYAGRRRELVGIGDSTLSSGFVTWSGNALPIPKIQLSMPDFVPLKFTKNFVAIKASYAHGWFNAPYIQGAFLHQKYIYARLGKPDKRFFFYVGLNHQVQWGGRADYLKNNPVAVNGKLTTAFRDYVNLVLGRYPEEMYNDQYSSFDGENRIGNHIGHFDFSAEWKSRGLNTLLYHQHIYEDASGINFFNIPDGLWGIRFRNMNPLDNQVFQLRKVVAELLTTMNQSGSVFDLRVRTQGRDNYFNHSQYREGWSYFGRTIGTPFIMPVSDLRPETQRISGTFFPNNRVQVWYLGLEGVFMQQIKLTAKLSYSRNYGTYNQGYVPPINQVSSLVAAQVRLPRLGGILLTGKLATDRGGLLPSSVGGYACISKIW
ncbi:capsule assembly Wzi family protein [Tellurirhabdus bombi]|uniref:capsule assembly Wzi family protein n=1 Tax=Tellurirhabdus bombi TaxID=2907205 RepID=UPI001F218564|nr:capsule assembly Wzi family protein [Tellurirhabdus bombi]